jgi:hypothetical protein
MERECDPETDKKRRHLIAERARLEEEMARLKEQQEQDYKQDEQDYKAVDGQQHAEEAEQELRALIEANQREMGECQKELCHEENPTRVEVECGLALDCEGNELIVRRPIPVDLWHALSKEDQRNLGQGHSTLYLSICYCEQPVDPMRPVLPDACGVPEDCVFGRVRDSFRIKVSLEPPEEDERCEACCEPCEDACLLLTRIKNFTPGGELTPQDIHNEVRRMITPYRYATVTGISWTHGAAYTIAEARALLGTDNNTGGLEVRFSRPVRTSTLKKGVVDIWVVEGGRGRSADIYHLEGDYVGLPATETTDRFRYRQITGEGLEVGDQVLIMVRTEFILDPCCKPVDGAHVGGRVPIISDYSNYDRSDYHGECVVPPTGIGPWTSGTGVPNGSFISWFFIK